MIHVLNFEGNIIDFISNNDNAIIHAKHNRDINERTETYNLTMLSDRATHFLNKNRVIIQDSNKRYREFIIDHIESSEDGYTEIEMSASYLTDIGTAKPLAPNKLEKMTTSQALDDVLKDTGWQRSDETEYGGTRTTSWTSYRTKYEILLQLCTTYDMSLDFYIELGSNKVKGRYVSLKEKNPLFKGKEIVKGKDLLSLKRTVDLNEVRTALLCVGPEKDDGTHLELVVTDDEAQEQFGLPQRYLWGIYEPESEDSSMTETRLRTLGTTELNKRKVATISYEVSATDIKKESPHEIVNLGDLVRIKDRDFNPPLYIEAEVIGEEYDPISEDSTYTFGQFKEYNESDLRAEFNKKLSSIQKKLVDSINNVNTIIRDTLDDELQYYEQKIIKSDTPPENPVNDMLWYDTSNPNVAVLWRYFNGEWREHSVNDVEQIGGITREKALFSELNNTFINLSIQHAKMLKEVYEVTNSEYLVDTDLKTNVNKKLNDTIGVYNQIKTNLDSMTPETATIGKLIDTQTLYLTYRERIQSLYTVLETAKIAIDERFKLLQSQYTDEKFNEAMQGVATAIGGTYNEETRQLIADIPNNEQLEELRSTIEQSLSDLTQANQVKLQELQDGITETNQRITSTNEELSAGITSVTQKVEGLKVGGRNLLLDSKSRKPINGSSNSKRVIYSLSKKIEVGKVYTLTYKMNVTSGNINGKTSILFTPNVSNRINVNLTPEKNNVYTFVATQESNEISIFFGTGYTNDNLNSNGDIFEAKLEEGNITTDWTPAPEDIKEVQVGGRNLLPKFNFTFNATYQNLIKTTELLPMTNQEIWKVTSVNDTSHPPIVLGENRNVLLRPNQSIVGSVYVKIPQENEPPNESYLRLHNYGETITEASTTINANVNGEWQRITVTFTNKENYDKKLALLFYPVRKNNNVTHFSSPKMEYGNTATDWTPAPEDTEASIKKAQQDATNAAQAYADAQDNLKAIETKAYADGVVDEEEKRAIADAQAKLAEAKTYAEEKAAEAKTHADNAVGTISTTVKTQTADIKILKDGISLKADNTEVTKIYDQYLTPLQTQVNAQKATLDVLPSQIAAKVSQAKYDTDMNSVVGRLNTSDTERIQLANQISDRVTLNEYKTTKEKIENLSIGGRNLLRDSKNINFTPNTTGTGNASQNADKSWTVMADIGKAIRIYTFIKHTNVVMNRITQPFELGKEYISSIEVVTDKDTEIEIYSSSLSTSNYKYQLKKGIKQTIKLPFVYTTEIDNINIILILKEIDAVLIYDNFKLEKGNIATAWTPAPEDITQDVDTKLKQRDTIIEQNGKDILLKASTTEMNASKQTLSRVLADLTINTTDGLTLSYDENGAITSHVVGPNGIKLKGDKVDIKANSEFNVLVGNVNGKVGKDEIINRLNLSSEGLDINVNNVGIRGGDATNYIAINNDRIELGGRIKRTWRGVTSNDEIFTRLKDGHLRFRNNVTNSSLYMSQFGISTYIDGEGEGLGSSGTIQWWDSTYSGTNANGITMNSYGGVVALSSDLNRIVLNAYSSANIESGQSNVYISPYRDVRPGLNRFSFSLANGDTAYNTNGYIMYGAGDEAYPYGSGLRFYKSILEKRVAVVDGDYATGGDTIIEAGNGEFNQINRRSGNSYLRFLSNNFFSMGTDTKSRIYSDAIYNRTYSSAPNMYITDEGTLGRSTSASKYKVSIEKQYQDENKQLNHSKKLLNLNIKSWFDKFESEMYAKEIQEGKRLVDDNFKLKRHHGLIAEDVESLGLDEFVSRGKNNEVEGILYDRLWVHLIPIIREQQKRIEQLEEKYNE